MIKSTLLRFCQIRLCCTLIYNGTTSQRFAATTRMSVRNDTDEVFGSEVLGSVKDVFFLCAAWGSAWPKRGWVQLVSKEQTEPRGTLKSGPSSDYLLLWKYKRPVLEEAFKRRRLFSVPDNSLPTDGRLIIQQRVIKGSTGRKGLSWQSTLLPLMPLSETSHFKCGCYLRKPL